MKDEYDFSGAEQGRFYRPMDELDVPIYLDKDVRAYFNERLKEKGDRASLSKVVNALLKKDIEISDELAGNGITSR